MVTWNFAARTSQLAPSASREMVKVIEGPGILSMAGGLPSPDSFPVGKFREAALRVLAESPHAALQYTISEGILPLREWIAARLSDAGIDAPAERIIVTNGAQQSLDLVGRVLIDAKATVAVEAPTYVGAIQAFDASEARYCEIECDGDGPLPESFARLREREDGPRFAYLQPNFQNPAGTLMSEERRAAIAAEAASAGIPLVEDDPYGDLWFDQPPPRSLASRWHEGTIYIGSFSKILSPGVRLGYVVAPANVHPKLVLAKQAADLHTSALVQRIVLDIVEGDFLEDHLPRVREIYRSRRDVMDAAVREYLPTECEWVIPQGGMFFWIRLPEGCDGVTLLADALKQGVAYLPGAAFYSGTPDQRTIRLSFSTLEAAQIHEAVARLGHVIADARLSTPVVRDPRVLDADPVGLRAR